MDTYSDHIGVTCNNLSDHPFVDSKGGLADCGKWLCHTENAAQASTILHNKLSDRWTQLMNQLTGPGRFDWNWG